MFISNILYLINLKFQDFDSIPTQPPPPPPNRPPSIHRTGNAPARPNKPPKVKLHRLLITKTWKKIFQSKKILKNFITFTD